MKALRNQVSLFEKTNSPTLLVIFALHWSWSATWRLAIYWDSAMNVFWCPRQGVYGRLLIKSQKNLRVKFDRNDPNALWIIDPKPTK